jgi:hypothetical protein
LDLFEIEENNEKWAKGFKNLNHEGLKLNEKLNEFEKRKLNLKIKPLVVAAIGWRWRLNQVVLCLLRFTLHFSCLCVCYVFVVFFLFCLFGYERGFIRSQVVYNILFNLLAAESLNKCSVKIISIYWPPKAFNKFFWIIFLIRINILRVFLTYFT